ncbi:hypothetical protein [Psychrobacter sp. TB55-MNA-CIBAN-0194]
MLTTDSPVTLDADVLSEISPMLDKSFADIDWQVPWMCHINQLSIISAIIKSLSSLSEQNNAVAYEG